MGKFFSPKTLYSIHKPDLQILDSLDSSANMNLIPSCPMRKNVLSSVTAVANLNSELKLMKIRLLV